MELNERLDKFEKLVSDKPSSFLSKLAYYKANKKWIDQSSKVAINVLEALSQKGLSQKDLAKKMNVSAQQVNKIIKGKQNLTFETISKLETALEISLIEVIEYKPVAEIKTSAIHIKSASSTLKEEFIVVSVNKDTSTT
ncbi:helix-turn-helix domain-containing protein [Flavobacterium xanthum]|uniref:Helix-turn-helix n=1 Tax=Flavobacterium xanthum TaxID=69322 RepID=A0A1M7IJY1_9FLAO|nr:helix-turn-helix transcriptional regulator [Flavobacterium xanthum]SHM41020.1 Helix-turn-helix [Flavobacterium xanthum]